MNINMVINFPNWGNRSKLSGLLCSARPLDLCAEVDSWR
jgi:hypothetical protein